MATLPRWLALPRVLARSHNHSRRALEDGTEPEIGGLDNLATLALCEAVFTGARDHRVTTVREFCTPAETA